MLMPSIFGENLFDDWMDFSFPDIDKALYGKHAKNEMKTDVRETEDGYELDIDLPGFKKDEVTAQLDNGYLTIQASKGLDKEQKDKKGKYIRKERYAGSMSRIVEGAHPVESTTLSCSRAVSIHPVHTVLCKQRHQ